MTTRAKTATVLLVLSVTMAVEAVGAEESGTETEHRIFPLLEHGMLSLSVPVSWRADVSQPPGISPPTITFLPEEGDEFKVLITPFWHAEQDPTFNEPQAVRLWIERDLESLISRAVEEDVPIETLEGVDGTGYYFLLTDSAYEPDGYPYLVRARVGVGDLLIYITVLSRSKSSEVITATLEALGEAMHIPPVLGESREKVVGSSIVHPVWGVRLEMPGYEIWEDHPLRGQHNFILAGIATYDACEAPVRISMFAAHFGQDVTPDRCRRAFDRDPSQLEQHAEMTVHEDETSTSLAYTLFDQGTVIPELAQNQLYGYWTHGETCYEVHISSFNCEVFRQLAFPIMHSVRIPEASEISLETVSFARALGVDPHHWMVRFALAAHYLFDSEPPIPGRARRFYEDALRLGGEEVDLEAQSLIDLGIGVSWLMENEGANAIPYFESVVVIARENPSMSQRLDESLFQLASAYSLAGDPASACDQLADVLERQPRSERQKTMSMIRKDQQLTAVREAECFQSLKTLAKKKPS